jgi:DNA-binding IclR family transcriptional regulator
VEIKNGGGTKSVENAIAVLLALADGTRPLSVTEIARTLGLHKSTVSRQLATLSRADFVKREEGGARYVLSLGLLSLAAAMLANHQLSAAAWLQMEMLGKETGGTVTFSGWNGHDAVNLHQIRGPDAIQRVDPPGRLNPAHCTATGKVFLASLPEDQLERRLAEPLKRYTDYTIVDPDVLKRQLAAVRQRGYATNENECLNGICAIAAPVRSNAGEVRYAIAVTVLHHNKQRPSLESIKAPLLYAAGELSTMQRLGM